MTIDVADDLVRIVRSVINRDKLRYLGPLAAATSPGSAVGVARAVFFDKHLTGRSPRKRSLHRNKVLAVGGSKASQPRTAPGNLQAQAGFPISEVTVSGHTCSPGSCSCSEAGELVPTSALISNRRTPTEHDASSEVVKRAMLEPSDTTDPVARLGVAS